MHVGAGVARASCTSRQSSPSSSADNCAADRRITPSSIFGQNSADAAKGLEFYKELYKCGTAPGMTNAYMQEGLDAFKSGQVAMQMNWFAFFPGLYKDPNVGGDKIGFFVNPAGPKGHFTDL